MTKRFQIYYFLGVFFWMNEDVFSSCVLLQVLTLFQCCFSIQFSITIFFVPIFCSKIVLFSSHSAVCMCLLIRPLLAGRIFFRCFGMTCFVRIVLSCLDIFLVILLSPVLSGLFSRLVLFVLLLRLLFSSPPNMFQCSPLI